MSEANETPCMKPGHFSWNELMTTDTQASAAFYGKLFGWQAAAFAPPGAPAGSPPYTIFKTDAADMGAAGMMQIPAPGVPTHWLSYVVVENLDQSLAKAAELGATILLPAMTVPTVGRIAVFQDPLGAVLGLHEPPK